jgi:hypothetical protein
MRLHSRGSVPHSRSHVLLAPVKGSQTPICSRQAQSQLHGVRVRDETVNAQLQEPLDVSTRDAKSPWGLMTHMAVKMTAHRVSMIVNPFLERPPLQ